MRVLVTGATGVLGSRVKALLDSRGVSVVSASRREHSPRVSEAAILDLGTGEGIESALQGVQAVVHCATDARRHRVVDDAGTRHLVEAAKRAGVAHILYPGIVGSDVIALGYYKSKIAAEETITESGLDWTVLRATQFHQFIWRVLSGLARLPVLLAPRDTRFQPIDPHAVAQRLVDQVLSGPGGRLDDLGGARAYEAADLARSYLAAVRHRRPVVRVNYPGLAAAGFRAGGNLTPRRDDTGMTWNDFVMKMLEPG